MSEWKRFLTTARRVAFYVVPALLLLLILRRVDFPRLLAGLRDTTPGLIVLGVCLRPLQILLGGLRWRLLGNHFCKTKLSRRYMVGHYWAGVAVGYFTPGNLGWHAYRVITLGRRMNAYTASLITIVAEKLFGLLSVLVMCLVLFPLVVSKMHGDTTVFRNAYLVLSAVIVALIASGVLFRLFGRRGGSTQPIQLMLNRLILRTVNSIRNQRVSQAVTGDLERSNNLLSILKDPGLVVAVSAYSIGILVVAAVCSQLILRGMGQEMDFLVNLFAAPVFFILFLVPVSFGSLGVREAAFILFYGRFGVELETALLLSFFNLMGLMLNSVIGALMIWVNPELRDRTNGKQ